MTSAVRRQNSVLDVKVTEPTFFWINFALPYTIPERDYRIVAATPSELYSVTDTTSTKTPDVTAWLESQFGKPSPPGPDSPSLAFSPRWSEGCFAMVDRSS
jgi:hypothetical protein